MDLFTAEMKANNPIHQAIQELLEAIQNNRNIKDYDSLLMLIKDGNLSQVPEKIEFLNNSVAKVFGFNKDACQVLPKQKIPNNIINALIRLLMIFRKVI